MDNRTLRKRRESLGLSQVQLAEELGVAANTVARWERGELAIGSDKMLSLALSALKTAGFRRALADAQKKLPRVRVAYVDSAYERRIRVASERLYGWISSALQQPDDELRRTVRSRTSFPGYRVLRRLATGDRLNPTTRSDISWATLSIYKALQIASKLWSVHHLGVVTISAAQRKRSAA